MIITVLYILLLPIVLLNYYKSQKPRYWNLKKVLDLLDRSGLCFHIPTNPLHNLSPFRAILHEFLCALLLNFLSH